ncbi:MAG TPA: TonB-dependent receptor, partial [Aequorivita sp.]|nr:TonB-dependent receptor [Aequorivita sp.]
MKISVITFLLAILPGLLLAQTTISGTVMDNKGMPVFGANVYLEGAYDGSTTEANGNFSFETTETGTQVLIISY